MQQILVKVARADRHIEELQQAITAFFDTKPFVVGARRDPETRKPFHYVASAQSPPATLSAIAGDTIQNLRSALDHLAYQLVVVGTGKLGPFEHVYFPIHNDAASYAAKKAAQVKGMRSEAVKAIDALGPYRGGDDTLWRLHKLNQVDKHRTIVTVGTTYRSVDLGGYLLRNMLDAMPPDSPMRGRLQDMVDGKQLQAFFKPADRMFPLKAGNVLFIGGQGDEIDTKLEFRFDVGLGEPGIVEGDPLLDTLQEMAAHIRGIVMSFQGLLQ
jgi:hypothetical protein